MGSETNKATRGMSQRIAASSQLPNIFRGLTGSLVSDVLLSPLQVIKLTTNVRNSVIAKPTQLDRPIPTMSGRWRVTNRSPRRSRICSIHRSASGPRILNVNNGQLLETSNRVWPRIGCDTRSAVTLSISEYARISGSAA